MATDAGVLSRGAIDAYKHQGQDVSATARRTKQPGSGAHISDLPAAPPQAPPLSASAEPYTPTTQAPAPGTPGATGTNSGGVKPRQFMGMAAPPAPHSAAGAGDAGPQRATEALQMQQAPTAEKMACGILAIGDMTAATIDKTAAALGGALGNFASSRIAASAPLSEPLTISRAYATRLGVVQMFTQPAAQGAQLAAQYAGELMYYVLLAAAMVYRQLAAMKVLPQIMAGGATDASGVPRSPVDGLPLARDELAAFKLVGAALLMAYVQVYDALEEAATQLFRQASSAAERYLAHRHGGEAADVASAALAVLADVLTLTLNGVRLMGRGLVSRTAAGTAKAYLKQHMPDAHLE